MDSKSKIILGALFGVALISAFAYALPASGRQNAFGWMMGGASQNGSFGNGGMRGQAGNGFGMMGNSGFGMMGQQSENGFNFSAMHGGNSFGMMGGNRSFGFPGNAGFGMMRAGFWNGTGFNSSAMLSMHNLMHGTNLTAEEFANLHQGFPGFGNASVTNSSFFGCPMHSGVGDADDGDEQVGQSGNSDFNSMAQHHAAMHGGNGFGMMGGRRN